MGTEDAQIRDATPKAATPSTSAERVIGFDLARSFAILGMILVHFSLVMAGPGEQSPRALAMLLAFLDGRAAATFVVLAGVGVTLMSRRAVQAGDQDRLAELRRVMVRRGVFLLAVGFANLAIWPGDILRVYGATFLMAAWLLTASDRTLLAIALGFGLGFVGLFLALDFDKNWEWETLTYRNLWTLEGIARSLFYDGFRSVFPWSGLVFAGMWIGRLDLREPATNRRVLWIALLVMLAAELLSWGCVRYADSQGMEPELATALFGTESMPALPLFLTTAITTAVATIALSVRLGESELLRPWLEPLAAVGRMALTWYIGHIVIGLGAIVLLEQDSKHTLPIAMAAGLAFYAAAMLLSSLWMRRFPFGPLEWVMRKLCG